MLIPQARKTSLPTRPYLDSHCFSPGPRLEEMGGPWAMASLQESQQWLVPFIQGRTGRVCFSKSGEDVLLDHCESNRSCFSVYIWLWWWLFLSQFIYDCCYLMKRRVKHSGGSIWSTVKSAIRSGSEWHCLRKPIWNGCFICCSSWEYAEYDVWQLGQVKVRRSQRALTSWSQNNRSDRE